MGHSVSTKPLNDALCYFGATEEIRQDWSSTEPTILVLPESLRDLADIFAAVQSQWRWHDGRIIGLDYAGIRAYLILSQRSLSQKDFARLQYLESICLNGAQSEG